MLQFLQGCQQIRYRRARAATAAKQLRREGKRINATGQNGAVGFSMPEDQVAVS